jgi:hypothetical protein
MIQGSRRYWGAVEQSINNSRVIFTKYICRMVVAVGRNPPLDIAEGAGER